MFFIPARIYKNILSFYYKKIPAAAGFFYAIFIHLLLK